MAQMNMLYAEDVEKISNLPYPWEKLKGSTVLISGGTGFIGTFLCDVIRYRNQEFNNGIKVISLSRRGGYSDQYVHYQKCDITKDIVIDQPIDYVLHLASNTHPKQYAEEPIETITTNVIGCNNLLKLAKQRQVKRFLLASSVEIYGQGTESPMKEDFCGYLDCNNARNGYNESKRVCESLCQAYRRQYGIDSVVVRLARVFGYDKKQDTKAMSQFLDDAVAGRNIVLKSLGNQHYSYCYVADAASGIIKMLLDGQDGEAYNIAAPDKKCTLGQYAKFLAEIASQKVIYQITEDSGASKATYALMDTKKAEDIGWHSLYSVKEGLLRTYRMKCMESGSDS